MKLELDQAIRLKNDFKHLAGRQALEGFKISKLIVVPEVEHFGEYIKSFSSGSWGDRNDEEKLASAFSPKSYDVFCLCNYHPMNGDLPYISFSNAIKKMDDVDFSIEDYQRKPKS